MRESARQGRTSGQRTFHHWMLQEASGAWADVTTSKTKTDQPTAYLNTQQIPNTLRRGVIKRIRYRLNFANAVTYTLRLWGASKTGDYESAMHLLWESAAAQADDTEYTLDETDFGEIPFILARAGRIYVSVEWSAACGNIQGFIRVDGIEYL